MDTDVSFATDIAELWKMFSFLNGLKVGFVWYIIENLQSLKYACLEYQNNIETTALPRYRERERERGMIMPLSLILAKNKFLFFTLLSFQGLKIERSI